MAKLKIAIFSTLWGSSTGGIDVFSRELIEVLASKPDMEVCAFYQVRSEKLVQDSQQMGFLAITPSKITPVEIDVNSLGPWTEEEAQAVILQVCFGKEKFLPDLIIINDIFGRYVVPVVREYLPDAKVVTLFHSAYGRSEARKGVSDSEIALKESFQRDLIENSDLALSVGSFATEYLKNLSPSSENKIGHIPPGLPRISSVATKSERFNAASFGRLDKKSDTIKQISVSAEAWTNARNSGRIKKLKTDDVSFFAIGSRGDEPVLDKTKQALESTWRANIRELPFEEIENFEESDLRNTLDGCSFVLLNSWYENFGLTFLETCTFGVPTLISTSSGFYKDAINILGSEVEDLLLGVPTDGITTDDLILDIEKTLIAASANYDETYENAKKLSSLLKEKWPSWVDVADQLLSKAARFNSRHKELDEIEKSSPLVVAQLENTMPWRESLADLMEWSWSNNLQYYTRLRTETDIKNLSALQLTCLQKKFWDRKEEILESGFKDVILSGGTSSGKTTLAELMFGLAKPNEFARTRILYIAPTKALAQEKARSWKGKYPSPNLARGNFEPVIVSTGDDNASDGALVRGEFNIASTVYEKANVILSASQELFSKLNLVVIDEFHMIEDLHRGSVIESLLAKVKKEKERRLKSVDEDNHLRLVIITTEGTSNRLARYLTYLDYDTLVEIAPLVIIDSSRAKPIAHSAFFPGRAEGLSLPLLDIKKFKTDEPFSLSTEEASAKSTEYAKFRSELSQIGEGANVDKRQLRWDQYREFIDFWFDSNPVGKRLLIFMNSKYEVIEVAKFLKNRISQKTFDASGGEPIHLEVNQDGIDIVAQTLDEVEPTDFCQDLRRCLQEGVFVHDADVPQTVRASFEHYLSSELSINHRSEIILATETLSYGVNLRVTDVALFNVLFPEGERIQTKKPPSILLSRCDFVNMSGRAGRLGQLFGDDTARVFWYLDPEEEKSFEAVVKKFYVDAPTVSSNLFHKTDTDTLLDYKKRNRKNRKRVGDGDGDDATFEDAVEKFSYPFVKTVLDGLRFLGGTETRTGFLEKVGCTDDELVQDFFENTFYFHEKCEFDETDHELKDKPQRLLRSEYLDASVRFVLKSAGSSAYSLVREPKTGGYQVTPLGSSTIDTGTEIATVSRLRQSVLELNREWEKNLDETLPFEMAVLPVFFQPEVHRQYLLRLPEFSHAMDWNPIENRSDLINRVSAKLVEMGAGSESMKKKIGVVIDHFLKWTVTNQPIVSESRRGYEEAAHDGCLRLFLAFLTWISGTSLKGVIGEVQTLYESAPTKTESSVFNFEAFADNLTWKILFLISLIRASEERILPPSSTFDAVRFVLRARFGCVEHAIPLLFKNKGERPPLNRVDAHFLLSNGYSTASIAVGGLDENSGQNPIVNRKITGQVRKFIDESFQEIARQFNYLASGTGANKTNEDSAKAYWDFAQAQVSSLVKSGQRDHTAQLSLASSTSEEPPASDDASMGDTKLFIKKIDNGIGLDLFTPIIDRDDSEKVAILRTSEFSVHFVFEDADREAVQHSEPSSGRKIFVDFPWAAGANFDLQEGGRLSPAAFGIVLSLCARNFVLDVSRYLNSLTDASNKGPIGVRELYRVSEPHLRKNTFPEAIFEAWAKYIEVGEF